MGKVEKTFVIFKSIVRLIFFKVKFLESRQDVPNIINSYIRADYSNFIKKLTRNNRLGSCFIGYRLGFVQNLRCFRDVWRQKKINNLETNETLLLYFLIKNNDIFQEFIERQSVVILFSEVQIFENYIAQLARQVGCYTIGLQHGFYSNDYDRYTVNSLNYQNIAVDEMLVWGINTKKLLMEHNPNLRVTVVGRPSTHFLSDYQFELDSESPTSYLAVLDADEFRETNEKILEIVERLSRRDGIEYFLKCHPSTNLKDHRLGQRVLRDISHLGTTPYFVGHRSSLLLELVADGFFCLVLNNSPFGKIAGELKIDSSNEQRLAAEDVSDYLASASAEAETLIVNAITKHISPGGQSNTSTSKYL